MMNEYQKMVVIFVDLLGTKNNEKFDDKYFIHRLFHSEARTNEERNLVHVIYDRRVYSFSDCAYIFYFYKNGIDDNRKDDMKLLQVAMSNTANSLLRILKIGYLVRGGIALGEAYFDELGFFGPAVEEAYKLECSYADVPVLALNPCLGQKFYDWENSTTDMAIVNLLMTSRPTLVEKDEEKYFLNIFYQLEAFMPSLSLESDIVELNEIKQVLFNIISRDKAKYINKQPSICAKKSTIYEKLDWMEKYLNTKHNRLDRNIVEGGFSGIVYGD